MREIERGARIFLVSGIAESTGRIFARLKQSSSLTIHHVAAAAGELLEGSPSAAFFAA